MGRLSEAEHRQLAAPKLKVDYELTTTSLAEAIAVQETLADPTKSASFTAAFSTALVAKEAEAGRTVVVKEIAASPATVTSKTEAVVIAPTPAPAPPPAPPAAPAPAAAEEEEEGSDNGALIGGVVGGVVGLGALGGAVYMFKKKSAQE